MRSGARVAPRAGRTVLDREGAEAAQLDPVAARHRGDDLAQDGVDDVLDIALIEVRILRRDTLHQLGFDHRCRPPTETEVRTTPPQSESQIVLVLPCVSIVISENPVRPWKPARAHPPDGTECAPATLSFALVCACPFRKPVVHSSGTCANWRTKGAKRPQDRQD